MPRRSWNVADLRYSPANVVYSLRSSRTPHASGTHGQRRLETLRPDCCGPKRILRRARREGSRSRSDSKHAQRRQGYEPYTLEECLEGVSSDVSRIPGLMVGDSDGLT